MRTQQKHTREKDVVVPIRAWTLEESVLGAGETATDGPGGLTLFDLVSAVIDESESDEEAIATLCFMLGSGSVTRAPAESARLPRAV